MLGTMLGKRVAKGKTLSGWLLLCLMAGLLSGCAASRSEVSGLYPGPAASNAGAATVSVFFLFKHQAQQHGLDSIPKLQVSGVKDFNHLFGDALGEISNIASYETFTDLPTDVNNPERRTTREQLRASHDYTLEISFFEESSFRQQCFSGTISLLSLTLIPMPYSWDYTIAAKLYDRDGRLLRTYQRQATLSNWVEVLLMFAYPFHPMEGKREEIYASSMHDIFRQIEAEKVLKK